MTLRTGVMMFWNYRINTLIILLINYNLKYSNWKNFFFLNITVFIVFLIKCNLKRLLLQKSFWAQVCEWQCIIQQFTKCTFNFSWSRSSLASCSCTLASEVFLSSHSLSELSPLPSSSVRWSSPAQERFSRCGQTAWEEQKEWMKEMRG